MNDFITRVLAARVVAVLALAALTSCASEPEPSSVERPDIVLVVVDTLRADHLSTYGYHRATSPGLDLLAERGVVFEDATAQSSWTLPSMASMLSGRHVFVNAQRMPPNIPSLAERLSEEGYETAAFVGNSAMTIEGGYARGFDTYVNRKTANTTTWDYTHLEAAFESYLDANPPGDAPRFYFLHYLDPHDPYEPPAGIELAGEVQVPDKTVDAWGLEREARGEGSPLALTFDEDRAFIEAQVDAYDREIVATDASIMRMLDRIFTSRSGNSTSAPTHGATASDAARLADALSRHLVVVASDHGEVLWERRHHPKQVDALAPEDQTLRNVFWRDHSYHMFQSLLATPLIVAGADFARGVRSDTPVENVDIMPTLLRAAGVDAIDERLDGTPLHESVESDGLVARPYIFAHSNEATVVRAPGGLPQSQDDSGDWKLVFPTDTGFSFGMPMQLYDLEVDATEWTNNFDEHSNVAGKLLNVREKREGAFTLYDGAEHGPGAGTREELINLGYIERDEPEAAPDEDDDHK